MVSRVYQQDRAHGEPTYPTYPAHGEPAHGEPRPFSTNRVTLTPISD